MKKTVCVLLCMMLILLNVVGAYGAENENRLYSLGVLDGVSHSETVTRRDFIKIAARLLGFSEDGVVFENSSFTDTQAQDNSYIAYCHSRGVLSDSEDGRFRPLDNVTYYEAVKMLICILGYDMTMENSGVWPDSYMECAAKVGLTKGVAVKDGALAYEDMIRLVNNALDIQPLEVELVFGRVKYDKADNTLYEQLMFDREMNKVTGIFEAMDKKSVISPDITIPKGSVRIAGNNYYTDKDFSAYLGYYVEAYISEEDHEVTSVMPYKNYNNTFTADAEDCEIVSDRVQYTDENGRQKTKKLSRNAPWVINGRLVENPTEAQKKIYYGEYTLLDNNNDGTYDIIFGESCQSYVVSRMSLQTNTIYFDDDLTYRGASAIKLDYEEEEKSYHIENAQGENISFEDIKTGDVVTIYGDYGLSAVRICVGNQTVEGKVSAISSQGSEVQINGSSYKIAKNENGKPQYEASIGKEGVYRLDVHGRIAGISDESENEYRYAYVMKNILDEEAGAERARLKLITGQKPQKHITKSGDDEIISYYYQNDESFFLDTENKITVNDKRVSADELSKMDITGNIIGYKLSSAGKINKIYTYPLPGRIYNASFNAKIGAYSSSTDGRGYLTNNQTTVICVPKAVNYEDDWYIRCHVIDKSTSTPVYGLTAFPQNPLYSDAANAEPVDFLIINGEMDSTQPVPVADENKVCIVGNVSHAISGNTKDDGEVTYMIDILEENERKTLSVLPGGEAETVARGLHKADLIQYVLDGYGRVVTIKKIASMQGLGDNYTETIYGDYYGVVYNIDLGRYDYISNKMVDLISVDIGTDKKNIKIFMENTQPIYRYDRKGGNIYSGVTEDISSQEQVGGSASKVYAHMNNNDVVALVIIEN